MSTFDGAMCAAVASGNINAVVSVAMQRPHLIDAANPMQRGRTPMMDAALGGHSHIIQALVQLGSAALDRPDDVGRTPMHFAAACGHPSAVETLRRLGSTALACLDNNGWTPMLIAARHGRAAVVETLHRLVDTLLDAPNKNGATPMYIAAENGHTAVVETLHRLGSTALDTPNESGATPMHIAARHGHVAVIETLHRLGSTALDRPNNKGATPMHFAAEHGRLPVIEALLRLGSTALDRLSNGALTPIFVAAANGQAATVAALHRLGSTAIDRPSSDATTPMLIAARNGHVDVVRVLHQLGSRALDQLDTNGWTPVHAAAAFGHAELVNLLCQLGSKARDRPDVLGRSPIFLAAENGHTAVVEALHRLGSTALDQPNLHGSTPLLAAAFSGHAAVIEVLHRLGSTALDQPNNDGWSAMHFAAAKGFAVVETLHRLGSTAIDQPERIGQTPMHLAAQYGHNAIVETLHRLGSKALDQPDNSGATPMLLAAGFGHAAAIVALHRLGSTALDRPDNNGWLPMHVAAQNGHASVIDTLRQLGSRALDQPKDDGATPMHIAAQNGHSSVIEALARRGSQALNLPDDDRRTPLILAAGYGHADVVQLLLKMRANRTESASRLRRSARDFAATEEISQLFDTIPADCNEWWRTEVQRRVNRQAVASSTASPAPTQALHLVLSPAAQSQLVSPAVSVSSPAVAATSQGGNRQPVASSQSRPATLVAASSQADGAHSTPLQDDSSQPGIERPPPQHPETPALRPVTSKTPSASSSALQRARRALVESLPELNIAIVDNDENRLSEGSSGVVLRVQLPNGRWAAAKTLHMFQKMETYQLSTGTTAYKRVVDEFLHEARILAAAQHKNIVTLLGVVPSSQQHRRTDGSAVPWWIVTELADDTLLGLLNGGPLTMQQCRSIAIDMLNGLAFIHNCGIVHRDLKPANVLLFLPDLTAKLCDFGLARLADRDNQTLSRSGTPQYKAPEVETGRHGHRADIYSFGIIFIEMVTGSVPSVDSVRGAEGRHVAIRDHLTTLQMLPEELNELVISTVHPDPGQRCTIGRLQTAISDLAPQPDGAPPQPTPPPFNVANWLASLNPPLSQYADNFITYELTSTAEMRALTDDQLDMLGVSPVEHRRQLFDAISQLH